MEQTSKEQAERKRTRKALVNAGLRNIKGTAEKTKRGAIEKMGQLSMFFSDQTKNETEALGELVQKVDRILGAINQEMES